MDGGERTVGADGSRVVTETIKNTDPNPYTGRLCIGTPSRGTIRMEWHQARIGQIIPINWSMVTIMEALGGYVPQGFLVADAQNLIIDKAVKGDFEWLLLYEDDMLPPADAFIKLNQYMMAKEHPIISALYFGKTMPPEPLVFRGRGNGSYMKWKPGDEVWVDGVPTGFLLIHMSILQEMWKDCEEYEVAGQTIRQMFRFPRDLWKDPETHYYRTLMGTSDLDWSTRVIEGGYLKKAGWPKHARRKYPFLVDTNLMCHHIAMDGKVFPIT
jgi:hypothetical protein